jgi:3-oxoacyl-[acyl-carrier-protein] synthase II
VSAGPTEPAVWVTGIGAVSPGGWSADETWATVSSGRSCGRTIERFDLCGSPTRAGACVPGRERELPADRSLTLEFGQAAAREALAQAGLADGDGVADGGAGAGDASAAAGSGVDLAVVANHGDKRVPVGDRSAHVLRIDDLTAGIARSAGARRWLASHGACAAGTLAVAWGADMVRMGRAATVLAGATDSALNGYDFFQFCNLHGMSERDCPPEEASCPFDSRRDGYLLGEGAGFLVLEAADHARARGAEPLAVVEGSGSSQNAHHFVALPPDAGGPIRAMRAALDDARLDGSAIDYVNAHGTSTRDNDWCETLALHDVFGAHAGRLAVSSTKSSLGHATSAAGAVEAVICVQALRHGVAPPTVNLHDPDPRCDLDYVPHEARPLPLRHVVSNSFGFGGHCASVVLGAVA